ncbi:response regulator [Paenibacillus sp. HB172176]|uniref:response regulator n=1 Tax=Paenibacillus sp. HB172176 TaxID=2493690 RepID=UPI00143B1E7E|nr:response regulator [Paenibacillus sp. HB172176]
MYKILIADDEPLICEGLSALLSSSDIALDTITTANSGYEALDYLRMQETDLLVTDIGMGSMNGIELMHQAKLIKPWVQTIIISAHETFQYAQSAIRLGAKDYLIKPLNPEQFLDSVRNALLKMSKASTAENELLAGFEQHFRMESPLPERDRLLQALLLEDGERSAGLIRELEEGYAAALQGPYYAVLQIRLKLRQENGELSQRDGELLRYAALNIVNELLEKELGGAVFYSNEHTISVIVHWTEAALQDESIQKLDRLEMVGRSFHHHIGQFLRLSSVIGISQILKGASFIPVAARQAQKAIQWNKRHPDHYVFYYGDFNWSSYENANEPTQEELTAQNNLIVEKSKAFVEEHFAQKGLTLHEVALRNHVSPNYLSYLFKKETGHNMWEYVIRLRMEESKRLLTQTDLRRYEISERVGYESPEHFSKIFKKYFGMSPSELKQSQARS